MTGRYRIGRRWLLPLLGALLAACSMEDGGTAVEESTMSSITGNVIYRERMMLPPGAGLEVQLEDVSRADAPATVLASVLITPEGGPPYPFSIDYDPAQIDSRMRYALRARIELDGRLLFTNTEFIDAFSGNPVEVLVRRVPGESAQAEPALEDVEWELLSMEGQDSIAGSGGKLPDLQFLAAEQRAAGFSGCNRYFGTYSREGAAEHGAPLAFGPLAGTMMACAEGGELERAFLANLARVNAFHFDGAELVLAEDGQELARFRAR